MRRIESFEDDKRGVVTYELGDGRRVCLDARFVAEVGVAECLRHMGLGEHVPTGRIAVIYHGEMVGTVPADFDPKFIKTKSFMYDPRPGDFRLENGRWVASNTLGPGDIGAIVGFVQC